MAVSVGSEDGDMGFQIAPMVDVVFVLLLFFMANAGPQIVSKELDINLPAGHRTPGEPIVPLVIDISREGSVVMNGEPFGAVTDHDLSRLKAKLKFLLELDPHFPIVIRPTGDTRHERVVDVLNACSFAQVKNLTFS